MFYLWKVRFLKSRAGNLLWRYWRALRGDDVGRYNHLAGYINQYAPGQSFADIGAMWGVNGEYAFLAERAGATSVKAVDVFGPTPEFLTSKQRQNSSVEFILGDVSQVATISQIGVADVVLCAGVLYHHPSPFDLLVALRRICSKTLILRTSTIPEISGLPNAAVYFPMLKATDRQLWNLSSLGVGRQVGITDAFEASAGYGNWFWGLTPSCVVSLLETAGFRVDHRATEPFAQTFICTAVETPFEHRLPNEVDARELASAISQAGVAHPA
jgi:hypothetical protein